jgi:two-component system, OmpR family, alkaline phosphatase synthesis response regulator PhoP
MTKIKKDKKILIVEDEEPMLVILRDSLADAGFAVATANNGEQGLMRAYQERPDLILLDIVMPKMDGLTVMKKLREDPWGKNVPIIFLTNLSADANTMKELAVREPAHYLVKSDYSIDDVIVEVKKVLNGKSVAK